MRRGRLSSPLSLHLPACGIGVDVYLLLRNTPGIRSGTHCPLCSSDLPRPPAKEIHNNGAKISSVAPSEKRRGWEKRCSSLLFSIPARNVTIRHDSTARPGKEGKRHQTQTLEKANPPSSPSAGPFDTKSKAITGVAAMQQGRGRKGGGEETKWHTDERRIEGKRRSRRAFCEKPFVKCQTGSGFPPLSENEEPPTKKNPSTAPPVMRQMKGLSYSFSTVGCDSFVPTYSVRPTQAVGIFSLCPAPTEQQNY